jgi:hypothetical protein
VETSEMSLPCFSEITRLARNRLTQVQTRKLVFRLFSGLAGSTTLCSQNVSTSVDKNSARSASARGKVRR